jgi:MFS transporter, DHA2 family, methylenomycin A resistance protein
VTRKIVEFEVLAEDDRGMSCLVVRVSDARRGLGARRRSPALGLVAICLGFAMITLDATIVNVALGPIVADLGGSLATAQWLVSGYTLAFASLLLTAGALADRVGARAGFAIGLGVFAVGSGLCAAAVSLPMLVVARVLQGFGAAWLMPCSLALVAHAFPGRRERRRALAIWGGASGIGLASGPVLGGVLTAAIGWRAIFLVNLPVAAVAGALLLRHVQETRRHAHPLDLPGQLLATAGLAMVTGGCILAGGRGWGAPAPLALLAGGVLAAIALVAVERSAAHPMVDPALFGARSFSAVVGIGLIFNFCLYGGLFCLAVDLHGAHGLDALRTGLALLPMTVTTGAVAFLSGRVVARLGEWPAMLAGLGAGVLAAGAVALGSVHGSVWVLVGSSAPLGITALAMPAMTAVAIASVPAARIGLASGVLNAARQTGGAFGVALLGALLAGTGGAVSLHRAFALIAGAYAAAVLLALAGRRTSAR